MFYCICNRQLRIGRPRSLLNPYQSAIPGQFVAATEALAAAGTKRLSFDSASFASSQGVARD